MTIRAVPEGWQMQYRRMRRSYERLQCPCSNSEIHEDDLYHFFQDAWHLKDWIKNDDKVPTQIRDRIENLVGEYLSLRLAADLANGTKHLILGGDKKPKPRENANVSRKHVIARIGDDLKFEWTISSSKGTIIAEGLVHDVVRDWDDLLRKQGLSLAAS